MLYTDFCTEFNRSVDRSDVNLAHRALMQELGRILVRDKQDFVDLLNESGYEAELVDSDIDLVDTFIDNVDRSPSGGAVPDKAQCFPEEPDFSFHRLNYEII